MHKNLISLKSIDTARLASIVDTSIRIKQHPEKYAGLLKGKKLYMLFEKTSTRTALGFGLGFNELGGNYFSQRWEDSNFAVGEIVDEARYVARNVDIILARLKHNSDIESMGKYSPVPVINGCCNKYHPTQALADCMTIKEMFHTYEKTMVYIGIWNNTFNSLASSFPRLGGKLIGVCPILNPSTVSQEETIEIAKNNPNMELYQDISAKDLKTLIDMADIVYTDTWVDMEFINNPEAKHLQEERTTKMMPYRITADLLKDSHAIVMHDMPIHTAYEIEREVVEKYMETILAQGENRRHVAKGIYSYLLGIDI